MEDLIHYLQLMLNRLPIGMDDIQCGIYLVNFTSGSVAASVNIPLVNDDVPECDETFTASIAVPGEGFRLGSHHFATITIEDEGIVIYDSNMIPLFVNTYACITYMGQFLGIEATGMPCI